MTPKQEQFARLYVETGNASEAYRQAYNTDNMKPETVTNEAYKLLQDPDISAMVDGLKEEARQRHAVTVGTCCTNWNRRGRRHWQPLHRKAARRYRQRWAKQKCWACWRAHRVCNNHDYRG